jgi:hypothetical protein
MGHHPLSHGRRTRSVVIGQITMDADGSTLAGTGRIGPAGEQSMPNLLSRPQGDGRGRQLSDVLNLGWFYQGF